jgi:hypothetical protein
VFFANYENAEIITLTTRRRNEGVDVNIVWYIPPPWNVVEFDISQPDGSTVHYSAITHEPINSRPYPNIVRGIIVLRHASNPAGGLYDIETDEIRRLRSALSAMGRF